MLGVYCKNSKRLCKCGVLKENKIEKTIRFSDQLNQWSKKEREVYSEIFRLGSMVDSNAKSGKKE